MDKKKEKDGFHPAMALDSTSLVGAVTALPMGQAIHPWLIEWSYSSRPLQQESRKK